MSGAQAAVLLLREEGATENNTSGMRQIHTADYPTITAQFMNDVQHHNAGNHRFDSCLAGPVADFRSSSTLHFFHYERK